jgi:hypothetical protein
MSTATDCFSPHPSSFSSFFVEDKIRGGLTETRPGLSNKLGGMSSSSAAAFEVVLEAAMAVLLVVAVESFAVASRLSHGGADLVDEFMLPPPMPMGENEKLFKEEGGRAEAGRSPQQFIIDVKDKSNLSKGSFPPIPPIPIPPPPMPPPPIPISPLREVGDGGAKGLKGIFSLGGGSLASRCFTISSGSA